MEQTPVVKVFKILGDKTGISGILSILAVICLLMVAFFIAGFIGGTLRGLVGLVKYSTSYKNVDIRPWYFTGMVVLSGVIGVTTAWVARDLGVQAFGLEELTPALAVVVGYAGGDILENLYKTLAGRETVFR